MHFDKRRLVSLALSVLILSSATVVGPVGTAVASHNCGEVNKSNLGSAIVGLAGVFASEAADCYLPHGERHVADQLNATDANETKTELYGSLSSVKASSETATDSMTNTLTMTKSIARMEAKNDYIRALDNGTTEATARSRAHEEVEAFYSVQEVQTLNRWEVQVSEFKRALEHAEADSGVVPHNLFTWHLDEWDGKSYSPTHISDVEFQTNSTTLQNGTQSEYTSMLITIETDGSGVREARITPFQSTPQVQFPDSADTEPGSVNNLTVEEPYAGYGEGEGSYQFLNLKPNPYTAQFAEIDQQHATVDGDINDFINGTYEQWQAGKINSSDLIDPYTAAREHSPSEDFQSWALLSLQMTGSNSVENMSQFGHMNVSDLETGKTHKGIVMSDGVPPGGGFDANVTYNASEIAGPQYVVTNATIVELSGEFTVDDMTNASGAKVQSVSYTNITYQTTDLTEYKEKMDDLQESIAEINARQDKLRGGIGGGGFLGGGSTAALAVIAVLAAIVLLDRR